MRICGNYTLWDIQWAREARGGGGGRVVRERHTERERQRERHTQKEKDVETATKQGDREREEYKLNVFDTRVTSFRIIRTYVLLNKTCLNLS